MTVIEARGATAIVVLDGGESRFRPGGSEIAVVNQSSTLRALEALRLHRLLGDPLVTVTAGTNQAKSPFQPEGIFVCEELIKGGIHPDRVVLDSLPPGIFTNMQST